MNSRWNWQEAALGKIDRDYRESFLREDKAQAQILIVIAAVWTFGFIFVEYLELNTVPLFYFLFVLRFLFFSLSLWVFVKLPQMNNPGAVDFAILGWSIAGLLLAFTSNISRDDITVKNIHVSLAWVLGYYLVLPTIHIYKSIPALLVSIFSIYMLFTYRSISLQEITVSVLLSKIGGVFAMNIIGFVIALRLDSQRYHQYLIQKTLMDGQA